MKTKVKKTTKKKLSPDNKKRILTNAGKAIGEVMKLKKVSIPVLSKKTGIKIADINDFISGKKTPTKSEVKLLYKALDVPKEVILFFSIEPQDVEPRKRELFNDLMPSMKGLISSVIKDDAKESKVKNEKKGKGKKSKK